MTDVVQRGQLSRDTIIGAAIATIERDGEESVSMRRIAAELRYGVMSLYNHVPSKEALLDAVAERVMGEFDFSADPAADWRDQARALVRSFRQLSRRYPRCLNVVITRQLTSTAGLRPLEAALATARAAGFHGETAVRIMRAFVAYALGSLMLSNARADLHGDPSRVDAGRFPNIADLGAELMHVDPDADFEFGLELLIGAVGALSRSPGDSALAGLPRLPGDSAVAALPGDEAVAGLPGDEAVAGLPRLPGDSAVAGVAEVAEVTRRLAGQ